MTEIRRQFRLSLLLLLLVLGLLVQWLVQPFLGVSRRRQFIRVWSRCLLAACGVRLVERRVPAHSAASGGSEAAAAGNEAEAAPGNVAQAADVAVDAVDVPAVDAPGKAASGGGEAASPRAPALAGLAPGRMLVANHPSWLDIFAIDALAPAAFVAKAEISRWPLAGALVSQAGTIFIERGRRRAVRDVIEQMRARMQAGWPVGLFPEASTHWGPALGPFHGNLLEAVIADGGEVVPIGVRYLLADGSPGEVAHFLGEQTFAQSVWAILGTRGLRVEVLVLPPVTAAGKTRAALAEELRGLISVALGKMDVVEGTRDDAPADQAAMSDRR